MIRVTFGECKYIDYSNKVMEFIDYHAYRNFIENCQFAYTVSQSITKFEKQVKDLTAQEIYKIFSLDDDIHNIDVCEEVIIVYGRHTYAEYKFEEYIDITRLIKD